MYNVFLVGKKTVIILVVLLVFLGVFFLQKAFKEKVFQDFSSWGNIVSSPTPTYKKVSPGVRSESSLFVPYWTLSDGISSTEDSLIYFGIAAGESGIDKSDEGYKSMAEFLTSVDNSKKKLLTLRMLDQEVSTRTLESKKNQEILIDETIVLASENGFDGIVLDLEYKALPFDSVVNGITSFVSRFYQAAKANGLEFSVLVYGDTFFRVRPYDIKAIGENSDEVMIMAYDFHKSGGNPGPNFPLGGSDIYGYDYAEMTEDFLSVVPAEKLTVVFGMFGYDWRVDEEEAGLGSANALSLAQMQQRFVNGCRFDNCVLVRDEKSKESNVTYSEDNGKHAVWFEDKESVEAKKAFLRDRGINSFSFWAHSFFE